MFFRTLLILVTVALASCGRSESPVLDDGVLQLDDTSIDRAITTSTGPLLVHFSSRDPNCGYCVRANDKINMMAHAYPDGFTLARITWEPWNSYSNASPETTEKYWIRGLPMVILYNNSKEVWRATGHTEANYTRLAELLDNCCR